MAEDINVHIASQNASENVGKTNKPLPQKSMGGLRSELNSKMLDVGKFGKNEAAWRPTAGKFGKNEAADESNIASNLDKEPTFARVCVEKSLIWLNLKSSAHTVEKDDSGDWLITEAGRRSTYIVSKGVFDLLDKNSEKITIDSLIIEYEQYIRETQRDIDLSLTEGNDLRLLYAKKVSSQSILGRLRHAKQFPGETILEDNGFENISRLSDSKKYCGVGVAQGSPSTWCRRRSIGKNS